MSDSSEGIRLQLEARVAEHKYSGLTEADHAAQLVDDLGLTINSFDLAHQVVSDFFNVGPTELNPDDPAGTDDFLQDITELLDGLGIPYVLLAHSNGLTDCIRSEELSDDIFDEFASSLELMRELLDDPDEDDPGAKGGDAS